jgi:hypothetical protein
MTLKIGKLCLSQINRNETEKGKNKEKVSHSCEHAVR